jgi:hypothetical protein
MLQQKELIKPSTLLDAQGNLKQVGWSRQPLLDCNLERARFYALRPLQRWRIKRWDYYGLTTPTRFFSVTLSHVGYIGLVFAYDIDLATGAFHEETLIAPLGRGVFLPRNSSEGQSFFDNGKVRLAFQAEPETRRLAVKWPGFGGGDLAAEIALRLPATPSQCPLGEHESMNIVIPIGRKRFYYNRKVNCMPAEGWVERDGQREELLPAQSLGNMDWGRGVWEYSSFWVWASASGFLGDGRTVGLNMGFGFGDTSAATENALILNGRIHKLGQIKFDYDAGDFMRPWRMTSDDGRVDLEFRPFVERVARTNFVLLFSEVHQLFGRYHGTVQADDGEIVRLEGLVGFAEEHHARW